MKSFVIACNLSMKLIVLTMTATNNRSELSHIYLSMEQSWGSPADIFLHYYWWVFLVCLRQGMGNSESQYSVQRSGSNGFILPGRQKPYSLKFRSAKEGVTPPQGWWRVGSGVSGFKSRAIGRGCLSQPKSQQSYMSPHCDYVTKGREVTNNGQWSGSSEHLQSRGHMMLPSENGCHVAVSTYVRGDCNGHAVNGHKTPEKKSGLEELENQSSPRVIIKSDGSVRVEFNNISNNSLLPDEYAGPVQLIKFSPTMESLPAPSAVTQGSDCEATPAATNSRTSKGSSLSSEGSWYDSPWGTGGELDEDSISPNRTSETLPLVRMDYFDQQLPGITISDLYRDPSVAATFPTIKDLQFSNDTPFKHRLSFVSAMKEPAEEECPGAKQYSSFTLPCRKSKPITDKTGKKESIRSQMRRLSDWTGSLTRKKRKSKVRLA